MGSLALTLSVLYPAPLQIRLVGCNGKSTSLESDISLPQDGYPSAIQMVLSCGGCGPLEKRMFASDSNERSV